MQLGEIKSKFSLHYTAVSVVYQCTLHSCVSCLHCCVVLQREQQQQLQEALAGLPQPKNDYEIVIPEDEQPATDLSQTQETIEDQSDLDNQAAALLAAEGLLFTDRSKTCRCEMECGSVCTCVFSCLCVVISVRFTNMEQKLSTRGLFILEWHFGGILVLVC